MPEIPQVPIVSGIKDTVTAGYRDSFSYLGLHGEDFSAIEKELILEENVEAPVRAGDVLGYLVYRLDGQELGRATVISKEDVEKAGYLDYFKKAWGHFLTLSQPADVPVL